MHRIDHHRNGFTLTEVIVCASLLVAVMSFVANISLRTNQLWKDVRHQKTALDELSNQMEFLTTLDETGAENALANLQLSSLAQQALPEATVEGELQQQYDPPQIVLTLRFQAEDSPEPPRHHPLTLVGFLSPSDSTLESTLGEDTP